MIELLLGFVLGGAACGIAASLLRFALSRDTLPAAPGVISISLPGGGPLYLAADAYEVTRRSDGSIVIDPRGPRNVVLAVPDPVAVSPAGQVTPL